MTFENPLVLRSDRADGLTTLALNRPGQFNSLSKDVLTAIKDELDAIAANEAVRVVVIAGAGKAFCAGHDLKEMRANHDKGYMQALFRQCGELMLTLTRMPQPVIARVHGIATAAGCQLVSMCDLAVAADVAKFAVSGINVGLFCSTPAVGLARNLGRKAALEMLLTGGSVTKNYSRSVPGKGFIVDTTVTIGYDTPWRQVEAMLIEAANRTPGILETPAPRVFQTALSDFYPEYRLVAQAVPSEPRPRAEVMTMLHANIQDVFNEYNVQIMSPHYLGDPAQAKVVKAEDWHLAPAEKD